MFCRFDDLAAGAMSPVRAMALTASLISIVAGSQPIPFGRYQITRLREVTLRVVWRGRVGEGTVARSDS